MPVERYRFHCTDGEHAVIDRAGRWVRNPEQIWSHAERVAREVMSSCGGKLDWSGWIVDIHDGKGRRAGMLNFIDVRDERRAA